MNEFRSSFLFPLFGSFRDSFSFPLFAIVFLSLLFPPALIFRHESRAGIDSDMLIYCSQEAQIGIGNSSSTLKKRMRSHKAVIINEESYPDFSELLGS